MTTTKKPSIGRTPSIWLFACLTTLALALTPWLARKSSAESEDPIVLVVSRKSPLRNVSKTQLRNLYLRNSSTISGKSSEPVNLPAKNTVRRTFDSKILGLSAGEASRHWVDQKLRGRSGPPVERKTELNVQLTAYRMHKAVGYIRLSALKQGKLRVLTLDEKTYSDPEYALR